MKKGINTGLCLLLFSTPILTLAAESTTTSTGEQLSEFSGTESSEVIESTGQSQTSTESTTESQEQPKETKKEIIYVNGEAIEIDAEPDELKNVEEAVITEDNQNAMGDSFKPTARAATPTFSSSNQNLPRMDFVDVSSHQGEITVNDYLNMKKQGVTGVVVKLTESTTYTNPYARSQINNAKTAGLKVSAYHYSWFQNKQTAEAEAAYFANAARSFGLGTDTILVNDAEQYQINNGRLTENSLYFTSVLSNKYGYKNVHHYSMASWFTPGIIDMSKLGGDQYSWKAHFLNSPSKNNLLYQSSSAWQWASTLKFSGDRVSNRLFDVNIDYRGRFSNGSSGGNTTITNPGYTETAISKRKYINKNNGAIYEKPYVSGVSRIDTTAGMQGQLIYLTAESKTSYGLWYKFTYTKNGRNYTGWIKSTDLDDVINQKTISKTFTIKNNNGAVYDSPYVETTKKIDSTQGVYGTQFRATKSANTGYGLWYYGTYTKNNQQKAGWIKSTDLGESSNYESVKGAFYINKNDGAVYNEPYEGSSTKKINNLLNMKNVIFTYTEKATTSYGTWYNGTFRKNGQTVSGWVKSTDLDKNYAYTTESDTYTVIQPRGAIYDSPYNDGHTKRIGLTSDLKTKSIKVTKSVRTPSGLWYESQFNLNGKTVTGWIKSTDIAKYTSHEYTSGKFYVNKNSGAVYDRAYDGVTTKKINNLTNMKNVIFSYTEKATTDFGTWYKGEFRKNGQVVSGWVKSTDLDKEYSYKTESDTYTVIQPRGAIYDLPHNDGHTKRIGLTSDLKNKTIKVTKSVETPSGLWYESQFNLNGKTVTGWIKSTDIAKYSSHEYTSGKFYVNKNSGAVYDKAYDGATTKKINNLTNMKNVIFSYTEKATTDFGTWYKGEFRKNGQTVSGWVKSTDLDKEYAYTTESRTLQVTQPRGSIYDSPHNDGYTKRIGLTSELRSKTVKATKSVQTPSGLWYEAQFNLNGKTVTGWIKSTDVK